jgi:calcium/calmodulin-dependent protein kinase I
MSYLHTKNIVHRDIKLENILLRVPGSVDSIILADFGLSEGLDIFEGLKTTTFDTKCGTLLYMAPEYFTKESFTDAVDIWAVGILLFNLMSNGQHPFWVFGRSKKKFIQSEYVDSLTRKPIDFSVISCSANAKSLLQKMLDRDVENRYKIWDVLGHPWVTKNPGFIPLGQNEMISAFETRGDIKHALIMVSFLMR